VASLEIGRLVKLLGFADEILTLLFEDKLFDGLAYLLIVHDDGLEGVGSFGVVG
jgi:hypothetical protein